MYPSNKIIALAPVKGEEKWRYGPHIKINESNKAWKRYRSVSYIDLIQTEMLNQSVNDENVTDQTVASLNCRKRIVSTTNDGRLFEVNADSSEFCTDFGNNGFVDLIEELNVASAEGSYYVISAPLVADDVIMVRGHVNNNLFVGKLSGVVKRYDA